MRETADDLVTMTWEDAEDAFAEADAALLGLGSIEQHSIHLPVSTDTLRADNLTAELVAAAADHDLQFVRLPTLPYGYSEHHMNFPGTVTLGQETYKQVLIDIGESLAAHGADRLILVNCHGGNREPMKLAADRLQRDFDLAVHPIHWTDFGREYLEEEFGEGWGHAGDHETSVVEFYRDDLVKEAKKEPQNTEEWPDTATYAYFDDLTEQGGLGDPTNANPEVMDEIIERTTADILDALRADIEDGW
jgi:creatinine amidohydrolase